MTVGSLFAGVGGFDLAATRVFGEDAVKWQVEIDPWARRVLTKHWPNVPKFGDIREITGDELGAVDVICGGFPCQPFSKAGKQLGDSDERHLWPEMARIVQVVRPRWVVGENVPVLRSMGLDAVCADLESLDYTVAAISIPACAVGFAHQRERLWILAHSNSPGLEGREIAAYTERGNPKGHVRPSDWGSPTPRICGSSDGIPHRVDRIRGLGNAIVPQVAEWLFRRIQEAEAGL